MALTLQEQEEIRNLLKQSTTPSSGTSDRMQRLRGLVEESEQTIQEPEKKEGFFSSLFRPVAELGVGLRGLQKGVSELLPRRDETGKLKMGNATKAQEELTKSRSVPLLGEVKPAFTGQETTGEAAKKMLGYGAEVASFAPIGRAVKGVGLTLKGAIKQGVKQAVPEAAIGTSLAFGGRELQEGEDYKEAGYEALKGLGYGAAGGLLLGGVAVPLATKVIPDTAKFGLSKMSGLSRSTIETATQRGGELAQARAGKLSREGIGAEVEGLFGKLTKDISETGAAYQPVRQNRQTISIPQGYWEQGLKKYGVVLDEAGKVDLKASKPMMGGDKTSIEFFLENYAKEGNLSAEDFLNIRTALTNVAKFDTQKSSLSKNVGKLLRGEMNTDFRDGFKGLKELDNEFSALQEFLKETRSIVDKKGNVKLSTVVNSLKKGKEEVSKTLERLSPGIRKQLELLAAIEDIEYAAGNKIGAYAQNIIFGGGLGTLAGGFPGGVVAVLLTNPKVLIPILETYSRVKGLGKSVTGIISKLQRGIKPDATERKIIKQALQEADKLPPKELEKLLLLPERATPSPIELPGKDILRGQATLRDVPEPTLGLSGLVKGAQPTQGTPVARPGQKLLAERATPKPIRLGGQTVTEFEPPAQKIGD